MPLPLGCLALRLLLLNDNVDLDFALVAGIGGGAGTAGRGLEAGGLLAGDLDGDVLEVDLLAVEVVDVCLEAGVVGHGAVAAQRHVLAPVHPAAA